jgi:hypothetical protein
VQYVQQGYLPSRFGVGFDLVERIAPDAVIYHGLGLIGVSDGSEEELRESHWYNVEDQYGLQRYGTGSDETD